MMRNTQSTWFYGLFAISATALACSGGATTASDTSTSGTSSDMGGAGVTTVTSSSHSGSGGAGTTTGNTTSSSQSSGTGGVGGMGGAGGAGGSGPLAHNASDQVSAGHVMSSAGYSVHFTMGQPTLNQATLSSQTYRLRGGLVGATEKLP